MAAPGEGSPVHVGEDHRERQLANDFLELRLRRAARDRRIGHAEGGECDHAGHEPAHGLGLGIHAPGQTVKIKEERYRENDRAEEQVQTKENRRGRAPGPVRPSGSMTAREVPPR